MRSAQSTFLSQLRNNLLKLAETPSNVALQRGIVSDLVSVLPDLEDDRDFLVALTYKLFLDDVLRTCMEDDYVSNRGVDETVRQLASAIQPYCENKKAKFVDALLKFAQQYRQIPLHRLPLEEIEVEYGGINSVICVPTSETEQIYIGNGHDWPAFANLDRNLADPRRSASIRRWYINTVRKLTKTPNGSNIDIFCFIEKAYSGIGALALMPTFVSELQIPATVYRASYWDRGARITGEDPFSGTEGCLIYDVAIGGNALLEAKAFLEKSYGLRIRYAIVFLEYDSSTSPGRKMARERLQEEGVELISCLKYSDIEAQVNAKRSLVTSMRQIVETYSKKPRRKYTADIDKALEKYASTLLDK